MVEELKPKIKAKTHVSEDSVRGGGGPGLLHVLLPVKLRLLFQESCVNKSIASAGTANHVNVTIPLKAARGEALQR